MGNSDRANAGDGPGSQRRHKLEPHVTCVYDRPIQAPRAEGDGTYVSTGKMLCLFYSIISSLPGPLKEEKIREATKAEMWQREWKCSLHLQSKERLGVRHGEMSA